MLAAAREALVAHGVLAAGDELPPFFARFSMNYVLAMLVYPGDASFYVVKVAVQGSLDREYEGLSIAHAQMPRNTPRPLGLEMHRSLPVLVIEGVRHEALAALRSELRSRCLHAGIARFVETGVRAFAAPGRADADDALPTALEHAARLAGWTQWRDYAERVRPTIAALPRIRQHGDLSVNNLGVAGGELMFFDWEDFAFVDVPGFDVAVLLLSLHDFDASRLRERLRTASDEQRLMQRTCEALGMSPATFQSLFPAYLALFVRMKAALGYAPEVGERALRALAQWVAIDAPPSIRLARGASRHDADGAR